MWRGYVVGACLAGFLAPGAAIAAKERRTWIDPPPDLPVAAPQPVPAPEPVPEPNAEATAGDGAMQLDRLAATPQPEVVRAGSLNSSTCTTRSYFVAPGATVRVHAC